MKRERGRERERERKREREREREIFMCQKQVFLLMWCPFEKRIQTFQLRIPSL